MNLSQIKLSKISFNDRRLISLSFILFLPILLDFLIIVRGSQNSAVTMMIYAVSEIAIFLYAFRQIRFVNWIPLIIFALICLISYSYDRSKYFSEPSFLINTAFFIPIGTFIIFRIDNWNNFFRIFRLFSFAGVLMGAYIVATQGIVEHGRNEFFSYMEFAYALLPCALGLYVYGSQHGKIIDIIVSLLGLGAMLSFGARAAVLYAFTFMALFTILYSKANKAIIVLFISAILLIIFNLDVIANYLIQFDYFKNSRLLTAYLRGYAMESSGREFIYNVSIRKIDAMGVDVPGFFGSRIVLGNAIYPHNIVYEIMMDFGWILGPVILIWISYLIFKDFVIKKYYVMTMFAVFGLLGRFFISGSYIIEGKFWIFLFIILSISHFCPINLQNKPEMKLHMK